MPKDPSYVRLSEQHSYGIVADITDFGTLWSISGNDVKPFPDAEESPEEAQYVRELLRRGVLEAASKAEWQELQEAARLLKEVHFGQQAERKATDEAVLQEHNVQDIVNKTQRSIRRRRVGASSDEDFDASPGADEGEGDTSETNEPVKAGGKK